MTDVLLFTQERCGACATQREKSEWIEENYPDLDIQEVDIRTELETTEEDGVVDRDDLESTNERSTEQSLDYFSASSTPVGNTDHETDSTHMSNYNRRQFLGVLGAGAVASMGLAQPASARETPVVEMGNNYFDPIGLHVEPGTTVRFELAAGTHSATAYEDRIPSDASAFDSGVISSGEYEYTFEEPGTYDYYCIPHESVGMVGRVVVGTPGGPAEDSSIPNGEVPGSETIVQNGAVAVGADVDGSGSVDGGMMGHGGGGMMGGPGGGWGSVPFVGGVLGMLGVVSGLLYWVLGRDDGPPESDDSAMETLKRRYARGDIDDEEFQERRERLENGQNDHFR